MFVGWNVGGGDCHGDLRLDSVSESPSEKFRRDPGKHVPRTYTIFVERSSPKAEFVEQCSNHQWQT